MVWKFEVVVAAALAVAVAVAAVVAVVVGAVVVAVVVAAVDGTVVAAEALVQKNGRSLLLQIASTMLISSLRHWFGFAAAAAAVADTAVGSGVVAEPWHVPAAAIGVASASSECLRVSSILPVLAAAVAVAVAAAAVAARAVAARAVAARAVAARAVAARAAAAAAAAAAVHLLHRHLRRLGSRLGCRGWQRPRCSLGLASSLTLERVATVGLSLSGARRLRQ